MKAEAQKQQRAGVCDPVYRKLIDNMLEEHRNDPMRSALVFVNSYDFAKEDIEEYMEDNKIYAEVFEIDRMQADQRFEYLNCISAIYGSRTLPAIFVKDKFVGTLDDVKKFDVDSYMQSLNQTTEETL